MTERKPGAFDPRPRKQGDMEILELHIGMEFFAEHLHNLLVQVRIGKMDSHDDRHNRDDDQ